MSRHGFFWISEASFISDSRCASRVSGPNVSSCLWFTIIRGVHVPTGSKAFCAWPWAAHITASRTKTGLTAEIMLTSALVYRPDGRHRGLARILGPAVPDRGGGRLSRHGREPALQALGGRDGARWPARPHARREAVLALAGRSRARGQSGSRLFRRPRHA